MNLPVSARFGSTYTKIGTIQRRLAWPLRKDDTQICEAFHIKKKKKRICLSIQETGSIPGSGRSPGGENVNPLQDSYLENPMDRGTWRATVYGVTKSQS